MRNRVLAVGSCAGAWAGLALVLGLSGAAAGESEKAPAEAPRVTPAKAKLGGVSVGMTVAQAGWILEANGFQPSPEGQRRYVDATGDTRRKIRFRELPGPDGALTIYELDETVWYPAKGFSAERYRAETIQRFGPPQKALEPNIGRVELVYSQVDAAPTVIEVIEACQAELQKRDPKLSAEEAEKRASAASQYRPVNDEIAKTCPGASAKYRKLAEALEAPYMIVAIRGGRVDTSVHWPWVEAELIRRLGQEEANRVIAFGVEAPDQTPAGP